MATSSEFIALIIDMLEGHCQVSVRRMFGGHGIFRDGLMFGIIDDDILYLKADAETRMAYTQRGLEPFTYLRRNKPASLSYYRAPAECLEDSAEMMSWADPAYAVALRSARQKRKQG